MSLKAFTKGFATTAGPSFLRGWEGGSKRKETRRREDRQDRIRQEGFAREDRIRQEGFAREDQISASSNARTDLLAAANESPEAVEALWSSFSPELQSDLGLIKKGFVSKARRMVRNRKLQTETAEITLKDKEAKFEEAEGKRSGTAQMNRGELLDDDGVQAASAAFYKLTKGGITDGNWRQAQNLAGMIDKFTGNGDVSNNLLQDKVKGDESALEQRVMGDLKNYNGEMVRRISKGIQDPEIRMRLLGVADSLDEWSSDSAADRVYDAAFNRYMETGKTPAEANKLALLDRGGYLKSNARYRTEKKVSSIGKAVARKLRTVENLTIDTIMKEIGKAIEEDPDLFPGKATVEQLKQVLMRELGIDPMAQAAGGGPGGPLAGMAKPAGEPQPDMTTGGAGSPSAGSDDDNADFIRDDSLWRKHSIGDRLMAPRMKGGGGAGRGGGGRGGFRDRNRPVDATQGG